ncbi:MAG: hypothetical protein RR376_22375 [Janthinobacterium sp.]|nr:hypothetical protein SAMN05880566_11436 [Janthinobacterium sp. TND4EL3]
MPAMPSSDHPLSCRLAACLLALCGTAHAQAPSLDADTVLQMHRLQQLELATGRPLALATALCMDERLGAAWKLPGTGAMPPSRWQPVAERMRLMAEQCTVQDDDRQYRDTASWRAALEQKLQRRTQMEAERQRLRACVAQAATTDALQSCIAAPGQPPLTPQAWQRWLTIYANRERT